jgi:glycosyltransferase involved in cell wall biosynthesis
MGSTGVTESAIRPKVLFVGAFPPPGRAIFGGMVTSCRSLLSSTFAERVELTLIDSTQAANPPPGFPVRLLLSIRRGLNYLVAFERVSPDAVMLFAAPGASLVEKGAMAWYARLRGVPALIFPRGGAVIDSCKTSRVKRVCVRMMMNGAHKILCQGTTWRRFICEVLRFAADRTAVIPNWTASAELLAIGAARKQSNGPAVRLLFVGWLAKEKGVQELLEACVHLKGRYGMELILVGEGNMSAAARAYVAANDLESTVTFKGWLCGSDLHREYAAADIFVLPSWAEGVPNAMIEAMAAGAVVVVSNVGNVPDVITDGKDGILVPPRNVSALVAALSRVMDDRGLRSRIAWSGHERARSSFGVETAADSLVCEIDAAVRRGRG